MSLDKLLRAYSVPPDAESDLQGLQIEHLVVAFSIFGPLLKNAHVTANIFLFPENNVVFYVVVTNRLHKTLYCASGSHNFSWSELYYHYCICGRFGLFHIHAVF